MAIFDSTMIPVKELRAMGSGIGLRGNMVKKPKEPTPPKVDVDPDPNDNKKEDDVKDEPDTKADDVEEPEEPPVEEDAGDEGDFNEEETTVDENDVADDASQDAGDETPTEIPESEYNTDANDSLQVSDNEANFLDDVNNLYFSIRNTISRLEMVSFDDLLTNKVIIQVKQNLNTLLDYVYDFIIYKYDKLTYGQNLYIYSHLVLSYRENIHILKKIRTLADTI